MLYHSIYSVRDKKKVNAEVIDIREIEGAKGVRFQIVGRHPEDGTTVTTFCSAAVAEDYKEKMSTLPHGLSAESIEVAQDHIPTSEATVISTDGTPVDDDLETFVEDPLVGSPSEGTLTSAKVMAAEGGSGKKNCGCGQDPCKTYGAEGVSTTTLEDLPKDSLLNIIESVSTLTYLVDEDDVENYEGIEVESVGDFVQQFVDAANNNVSQAETVAGIDVQTPTQIAIETPDSDELIVPDPDLLVNGDGRVLGQQSGKVNTTPMHAEGGEAEGYSVDDLANMQFNEIDEISGFIADRLNHTQASWSELSVDDRKKILNKIQKNEPWMGWSAEGDEQIKLFYEGIYTNDDEDDPREGQEIMSHSLVSKKDYQNYYEDTKWNPCACDKQGCLSCFLEEYPHTPAIKEGGIPSYSSLWFQDAELNALDAESNGDQVKLFYEGIYTNDDEDDPREGQEIKSYSLVSARDYQEYYNDTKLNPCACGEQGCLSCFLEEYPHTPEIKNGSIPSYSSLWFESDSVFEAPITQPSFVGNKRVLIPTAVIGGLALAYLAKPELLSGSFDKISEMLGKLTKKGNKTE